MGVTKSRYAWVLLGMLLGLQVLGAEPESRPSTDSNNVETNALLFKKRVRRRYDTLAIVSEPKPELSPEVSTNIGADTLAPDSERVRSTGELLRGAGTPPPQPMVAPPRKIRREKEDEWLTPEQRLARELKKMQAGDNEEPREEKDTDTFNMAAEIIALGDKQREEARAEQQRANEEATLEEIALLLGEQWALNSPDEAFKFREYSFRQAMEAGRQRVSATDQSTHTPTQSSGTSIPRSEGRAQSAEMGDRPDRLAAAQQVRDSKTIDTTREPGQVTTTSQAPRGEGQSGSPMASAPALFNWSEAKGGRFAGIPSSLAPSIAPSLTPNQPARAPSAPPRSSWSLPEPNAASAGRSGATTPNSPWSLPSSPLGPSELAKPPAPPPLSPLNPPLRTPFLNPTPAVPASVRP